ncbi:MAG TPA: hypothetical protein VFF73_10780 [Planctomycetota bacterium]|nr:hypothetical protein [Planctomycetota bacterium]
MRFALFRGTILVLLLSAPIYADTVLLKNGRRLDGRVLREDGSTVTLEVCDGHGRMKIDKALVARVYKGNEAPPVKQGIFPAGGAGTAKAVEATPAMSAAGNPLATAATPDLERRLAAIPSHDELLAALEPTPAEADALARLGRGLEAGTAEAADELAAKGRVALVVAARALASPERKTRAAAAMTIARLAADERALPYLLALSVPERLIEVAADAEMPDSPLARFEARRALVAIAKTEAVDDQAAGTQALSAAEQERLQAWRAWWKKEQEGLVELEKDRDAERAAIRAELVRRGFAQYAEKGRVEVKLASSETPSLPEPAVLLPRLVLQPPSELALVAGAGGRRLRFVAVVENRGEGPLMLRMSGLEKDARLVQRVSGRYPGDAKLVIDHETPIAQGAPLSRFELLDETFAPALGARPVEDGGATIRGAAPGTALTSVLQLPLDRLPDGVYYLAGALPACFEQAGSAEERVAAVRVRIQGDRVQVLASLTGTQFLALQAERRGALSK